MEIGKIKVTPDYAAQEITFEVTGIGAAVLELNAVKPDVATRAMYHGFRQRVADCAASEKSAEGKLAAMRAMVEWLNAGNPWERERGAGGGKGSIELRAIAEVRGKTIEEVKAGIEATAATRGVKPAAVQAALVNLPAVRAVIERIRAEEGRQTGLNGDDLLGEV